MEHGNATIRRSHYCNKGNDGEEKTKHDNVALYLSQNNLLFFTMHTMLSCLPEVGVGC